MAHAVRGYLGKHSGFSHNAHPGRWWKFGFVALIATALGVTLVYSVLLKGSDQTAAPSPAGVTQAPLRVVTTTYTVQPGDTLSGVAQKFGVTDADFPDWEAEVLQINKIDDVNALNVGDKLDLLSSGWSSGGAAAPAVGPIPTMLPPPPLVVAK